MSLPSQRSARPAKRLLLFADFENKQRSREKRFQQMVTITQGFTMEYKPFLKHIWSPALCAEARGQRREYYSVFSFAETQHRDSKKMNYCTIHSGVIKCMFSLTHTHTHTHAISLTHSLALSPFGHISNTRRYMHTYTHPHRKK